MHIINHKIFKHKAKSLCINIHEFPQMQAHSGRIVQLLVPHDAKLPDISVLTPAHALFMIETMVKTVNDFRANTSMQSQKEIYDRVKEETRSQMRKLEVDILVEKQLTELAQIERDKYVKEAHEEITALKAQLRQAHQEFKTVNREYINEQVQIEREKYDALLREKENQNQSLRETFEKTTQLINGITTVKTAVHLGKEGEQKFEDIAATFTDFEGFEMIDTHGESNKGDYHLLFKEFNVLVDAKNYSNGVPIKERNKIKNDLLANPHMHFAWLISLNTDVHGCKKSPVTYELVGDKYVVYVNHLLQYPNPQKFLRILWSNCKELKRLIMDEQSDVEKEQKEYKMLHSKEINKIKGYIKNISDINSSISSMKRALESMQISMKESIDEDTKKITGEDKSDMHVMEEWWREHMERVEGHVVKSRELWNRYRVDNEGLLGDMDVERFKRVLIEYLDAQGNQHYMRLKGKTGGIEISHYRIKGVLQGDSNTSIEPITAISSETIVNQDSAQVNATSANPVVKQVYKKNKIINIATEKSHKC